MTTTLDRIATARTTAYQAHRPWVLIPCGATKRAERSTAAELYTGQQFTLGLRAALALTTPDRVLIVSARHGLLTLDAELDPYEQRIDQPGAITPDQLAAQLEELDARLEALDADPSTERTISLLPNAYQQLVDDAGLCTHHLLHGARGIGDQRALLATIVAAVHARTQERAA